MEAPLPIIGEPFAVEFANSLYQSENQQHEFLGNPGKVAVWFKNAPDAASLVLPPRLSVAHCSDLRHIRDATQRTLDEVIGRSSVGGSAVAVLNKAARRSHSHLMLEWQPGALPVTSTSFLGSSIDAFLCAVSTRCITFLGSPEVGLVRRCERPGCPMMFVLNHHKRRFCHETCSHRYRQARYTKTIKENTHG